jgi:hypothetical protein
LTTEYGYIFLKHAARIQIELGKDVCVYGKGYSRIVGVRAEFSGRSRGIGRLRGKKGVIKFQQPAEALQDALRICGAWQ